MKHIVLFQLIEEISSEKRLQLMADFKQAIEALQGRIPQIQHIEVGMNENPDEAWDLGLFSEFASLEDIKAYAVHPEHVAAAGILKGFVKSRACVDY